MTESQRSAISAASCNPGEHFQIVTARARAPKTSQPGVVALASVDIAIHRPAEFTSPPQCENPRLLTCQRIAEQFTTFVTLAL